jgi:hypothetical protein
MRKVTSTMVLAFVLLSGCMWMEKPKLYPLPSGEVTVVGNVIYCSGKPFAELRYLDIDNTAAPLSEATRGFGLVIYYYQKDKEVWIHPKERMSIHRDGVEYTKIEDMNRVWAAFLKNHETDDPNRIKWAYIYIGGKRAEKEDLIRSVFYDVKVSADGKYISYKTQGIIFNSSHKFLVEYGD